MPLRHRDTSDPVAWARQVNGRWPVRAGLNEAAAAWMDYLEREDPERLWRCAALAAALSRGPGYGADPKPWFYSGLFNEATLDEARRFAAPYPLTCAVISATAGTPEEVAWLAAQSAHVQALVANIRAEIAARLGSL
jgi:hypothetical protein